MLELSFLVDHPLFHDKSPMNDECFLDGEEDAMLRLTIGDSIEQLRSLRNLLVDQMANQFVGTEVVSAQGIHSKRVGRQMLETSFISVEFDDEEHDDHDGHDGHDDYDDQEAAASAMEDSDDEHGKKSHGAPQVTTRTARG